ncbi:YcgN family cysteine cluster protein [Xanthobacter sp. AM11]|uniref:YcgN family cysteine cluster protein n=1 Tax=Xanthobacter sp. AM11 TaxID=3380643 RepID=UPI0039BFB580
MSPADAPRPEAQAPGNAQAPGGADAAPAPFWRTTPLAAMTAQQWESLCDGCGRCCLVKLEDEDSGAIAYTDVACRLFDTATCRCGDYERRSEHVEDCVRLTPEAVATLSWLPPTCAYRLVAEGRDLPFWHPLVSGTAGSVAAAGISVGGKVSGLETQFGLFELVDHIVAWPVRWPKGAKGKAAPAKAAGRRPSRAGRAAGAGEGGPEAAPGGPGSSSD